MFNLIVDRSEPIEIRRMLKTLLPNAPILYLEKNKDKYSGCWKLAEIMNIKYNNKHWQLMELPGTTLYLYAAYFDSRKFVIKMNKILKYFCRIVLPVIRVMIMVKGETFQEKK